jgi:hypothetical protein
MILSGTAGSLLRWLPASSTNSRMSCWQYFLDHCLEENLAACRVERRHDQIDASSGQAGRIRVHGSLSIGRVTRANLGIALNSSGGNREVETNSDSTCGISALRD